MKTNLHSKESTFMEKPDQRTNKTLRAKVRETEYLELDYDLRETVLSSQRM